MFNEPVTIGADAVVLLDKDGATVPIDVATTARGGHCLTTVRRTRGRERREADSIQCIRRSSIGRVDEFDLT
jgi:hypothetical protein